LFTGYLYYSLFGTDYVISGFGKMLTTKGCSYDLTRSTSDELTTSNGGGEVLPYYLTRLNKRQKACRGEGEAIESLPSGLLLIPLIILHVNTTPRNTHNCDVSFLFFN
jgi:hypothetical protein